jgi:hypothetical protein
MNNYNLYHFYNSHHQIMVDEYFLPSFKQHHTYEINLIGVNFEDSTEKSLFGTEQFKKLTLEKINKIINIIEFENNDNKFITCDSDVQFFGNIYDVISDYSNKNYDIVFQKENKDGGVNTGFMLITPNQNSLNYFKKILSLLNETNDSRINDQLIGNEILYMINYATFDETIWNWSQGDLKKSIKLHHANCVSPVEDKIKQLDLVREFILTN